MAIGVERNRTSREAGGTVDFEVDCGALPFDEPESRYMRMIRKRVAPLLARTIGLPLTVPTTELAEDSAFGECSCDRRGWRYPRELHWKSRSLEDGQPGHGG